MTVLSISRSGNQQENGAPPPHRRSGLVNPAGAAFAAATAASPRQPILTRAETAPCTCPEHCERDHDDG